MPCLQGDANGFVFDGTNEAALYGALDRALALYKGSPDVFRTLSTAAMREDVSWCQSAKSYVSVYNSMAQW